ncbi:MAG: zinc ribbon domain-containing protein [Thermodesulfobacteriota bacterium]|nr:zinc ribbon domain-containing protein [Thermodesulfobacteriota bacterium]
MPIYEFKCNSCKNSFETLILGQETGVCPSCQSTDLERLLSACGFKTKSPGQGDTGQTSSSSSFSSACSGCSATNCSTCTSG